MTEKTNQMPEQVASAVFFPRQDMPWGEEAKGARDHIFEVASGINLRIRLFLADEQAPNILFFHGNGETARDYDSIAESYRALPASFIVAEYRGYGPSTGSPSYNTFLDDAHGTLDEVKRVLADEGRGGPLIIMGRSLGAAPAIELAASRKDDIAGLIVESGFARTVPLLELIGIPVKRLGITEDQGPNNLKKMGTIAIPTLILHAEQDEIIPFADAQLLVEANKDPGKVFIPVQNAGHNDIQMRAGRSYFEAIGSLLARVH